VVLVDPPKRWVNANKRAKLARNGDGNVDVDGHYVDDNGNGIGGGGGGGNGVENDVDAAENRRFMIAVFDDHPATQQLQW
jgi:hypothetical protein